MIFIPWFCGYVTKPSVIACSCVDEYIRQYVHAMTTNMLLSARRHESMSSPWPSTLQNELFEQFTSQNPQGKG